MANEDQLKLPLMCFPSAYMEGARETLRSFCAPLDKAAPGDIIGVAQQYVSHSKVAALLPITEVIQKTADPSSPYMRFAFTSLDQETQDRVGAGIVHLQSNGLSLSIMDRLTGRFDHYSDDAFYTNMVLTPDAIILSEDEYEESVFDGDNDGLITQGAVNDAISVALLYTVTSHHEAIARLPHLEHLLALTNHLCPVRDPDDHEVIKPLALPDLARFFNL